MMMYITVALGNGMWVVTLRFAGPHAHMHMCVHDTNDMHTPTRWLA